MTESILNLVHNPKTHRLDARKVAALYGFSLKALATYMGISYDTLKACADSPKVQPQLAQLVHAFEELSSIFPDADTIRDWMHHPNKGLRGKTPLWLLEEHGVNSFEGLAEELVDGAYA